jgi:hypothetical protein
MRADPSLALQRAIGQRLIASPDVLALIPADNILDTTGRPERVPCILIGEGQTVFRRSNNSTSYATLHIWVAEAGLVTAKEIGSAVVGVLTFDAEIERAVLHLDGFVCHDLAVTNIQYMRDPHGPYSHGIVTVAGIMKAVA